VSHLAGLGRLQSLTSERALADAARNTHGNAAITPIAQRARPVHEQHEQRAGRICRSPNVARWAKDASRASWVRCWRCWRCWGSFEGSLWAALCSPSPTAPPRYPPASVSAREGRISARVVVCCRPSAMKRNLGPSQASHRGQQETGPTTGDMTLRLLSECSVEPPCCSGGLAVDARPPTQASMWATRSASRIILTSQRAQRCWPAWPTSCAGASTAHRWCRTPLTGWPACTPWPVFLASNTSIHQQQRS
jgi:hypothetical protein